MSRIIRARAPLRISFAGGGTDVPPYVDDRGGQVINATINRYAYATIVPRDEPTITLRSLDYDEEITFAADEEVPPFNYEMDLAKGVIRRLGVNKGSGFEVFTHTDAPPGSGLGSSSTMVVALLGAFDRWLKLGLNRYEKAKLAWEIEREDLQIKGGMQDQYAATFGGFNFIEFSGGNVVVNPLRLPPEWVSELEYSLILAYTGKSRMSSRIIEDQINNYRDNQLERIEAMDKTRDLAELMKRHMLTGDFEAVGRLLDEAWNVKKKMSDKISSPEIDRLYEAARNAGALGGKISGAGGGGFMFFFSRFDRRHETIDAIKRNGAEVVHFGFTETGMQTWER